MRRALAFSSASNESAPDFIEITHEYFATVSAGTAAACRRRQRRRDLVVHGRGGAALVDQRLHGPCTWRRRAAGLVGDVPGRRGAHCPGPAAPLPGLRQAPDDPGLCGAAPGLAVAIARGWVGRRGDERGAQEALCLHPLRRRIRGLGRPPAYTAGLVSGCQT